MAWNGTKSAHPSMADAQDRNLPALTQKRRAVKTGRWRVRAPDPPGDRRCAARCWWRRTVDARDRAATAGRRLQFTARRRQSQAMLQRLGDLMLVFLGILCHGRRRAGAGGRLQRGLGRLELHLQAAGTEAQQARSAQRHRPHVLARPSRHLAKASFLALVLGAIGAAYLWTHLAEFHDALKMSLPVALRHTADALVAASGWPSSRCWCPPSSTCRCSARCWRAS